MSDMLGPPFRADHVGSLLRPPELLRARSEHQAGRLSGKELRRVEDQAIRDVVRMQQEVGLEGVTDGEFRRGSWHMDFLYQIGGGARTDQTMRIQFRNEAGPVEARPHAGRDHASHLGHRRRIRVRQPGCRGQRA
jgi:methionine synthase II (cobalamin-independent)